MYHDRAAVLLTAQLTAPQHSIVQWGDVPTWIAVFIAAVGGGIALFQLRQQRLVIEGEVERSKRRDELLDGQLAELRERGEDRARAQAESVEVTGQEGERPGGVYNGSARPITDIVALMIETLPSGETRTERINQWRTHNVAGTAVTPRSSAAFPVIRPKTGAECLFEPSQLQDDKRRLVVRFYDDARRRWQVDQHMHLESAPPAEGDGW